MSTEVISSPIDEPEAVVIGKAIKPFPESVRKTYLEQLLGASYEKGAIVVPQGTELTYNLTMQLIELHQQHYVPRLKLLYDYWDGKFPIFNKDRKPLNKPDNRLACNFIKYEVEEFNGYMTGIPVKSAYSSNAESEEMVAEKAEYNRRFTIRNNQEDNDSQLSQDCDVYGVAYEMLYQDEDGEIGCQPLSPMSTFIVVDDSILHRRLFGCHYYTYIDDFGDEESYIKGSISDDQNVYYFNDKPDTKDWDDIDIHEFGACPIHQFVENSDYSALAEDVLNLVDAYNEVISEKKNSVDYFGDEYLAILGAMLDEKGLKDVKDNRIINLACTEDSEQPITVQFLQRSDSDNVEENLLDRLWRLIFQLSMVNDLSDENFSGSTSGVALRYKLQGMSNLAAKKERKFKAAMIERYKMICNYAGSPFDPDDYYNFSFIFTRNIPFDIENEASAAKDLVGILSKETIISTFSFIDDPQAELQKIEDENAATDTEGYTVTRTNNVDADTESIIRSSATTDEAVRRLMVSGMTETEARQTVDSVIDSIVAGGTE